jgi:hypothetical protein
MLYALTKGKTKDDAGKLSDPLDFDNSIAEALKRYSKTRPRLACIDIPGTGSHDYALPIGWSDGFSTIVSIETPIGNVPETLLDTDEWSLYMTPTGTKLRLLDAPAATETVRMLFTQLHTEATLPVADSDAVANLAASLCCRQLAAAYSNTSDPTIQADVVNYRSKSGEYTRLADSLEKLYKEHLGIKADDTTAAAMTNAPAPDSGRVRVTHRRS